MRTRFPRGSLAYTKDGRKYIVEEVADGMVYCVTDSGAESEFPEATLMNEAEWAAKSGRPGGGAALKRDIDYSRIQKSRHYLPAGEKLDAAASEKMLAKADRVFGGILDFAAFAVATLVLDEHKERELIPHLSVRKARAVFNAAPPAVRARLLADILGARPDALVSAGGLGDNLIKAMITKGLEVRRDEYEDFQDRPRN
jgi:hypothetical protein